MHSNGATGFTLLSGLRTLAKAPESSSSNKQQDQYKTQKSKAASLSCLFLPFHCDLNQRFILVKILLNKRDLGLLQISITLPIKNLHYQHSLV
jgi:hypothetical protein